MCRNLCARDFIAGRVDGFADSDEPLPWRHEPRMIAAPARLGLPALWTTGYGTSNAARKANLTTARPMDSATLAPTRLWRLEVSDENGWSYVLLLDGGNRTATVVLNDILEHQTRFDDEGQFRLVPSWLREDIQIKLEAYARACALAAHAVAAKSEPRAKALASASADLRSTGRASSPWLSARSGRD